jgi:hypothetical protein
LFSGDNYFKAKQDYKNLLYNKFSLFQYNLFKKFFYDHIIIVLGVHCDIYKRVYNNPEFTSSIILGTPLTCRVLLSEDYLTHLFLVLNHTIYVTRSWRRLQTIKAKWLSVSTSALVTTSQQWGINSFLEFFFFFFGARHQTQGLVHAKHVLYHWAALPAELLENLYLQFPKLLKAPTLNCELP